MLKSSSSSGPMPPICQHAQSNFSMTNTQVNRPAYCNNMCDALYYLKQHDSVDSDELNVNLAYRLEMGCSYTIVRSNADWHPAREPCSLSSTMENSLIMQSAPCCPGAATAQAVDTGSCYISNGAVHECWKTGCQICRSRYVVTVKLGHKVILSISPAVKLGHDVILSISFASMICTQ